MDPVQGQLDAYNDRDLERFVACYAMNVRVESATGNVLAHGHAGLREVYGSLFASSPDLHCRLVSRIRAGAYVLDEERVTGVNLPGASPESHAVAIYRLAGDTISHVRLLTLGRSPLAYPFRVLAGLVALLAYAFLGFLWLLRLPRRVLPALRRLVAPGTSTG